MVKLLMTHKKYRYIYKTSAHNKAHLYKAETGFAEITLSIQALRSHIQRPLNLSHKSTRHRKSHNLGTVTGSQELYCAKDFTILLPHKTTWPLQTPVTKYDIK